MEPLPRLQVHIENHSYGETVALEDCSFSLSQGTLNAVIGPNGGGKSTLLRLLAGFSSPTKGRIDFTPPLLPSQRAYLPQQSLLDRLFPLRVEDVAAMGLWHELGNRHSLTAYQQEKMEKALHLVGLGGLNHSPIKNLSGGQFQRLLFARMSLQEADIILLDEPFSAIDMPTIQDLLTLLKEWARRGKTIIAVMHDIPLVRQHFTNCLLISKSLIAQGAPQEVLKPTHLARAFFHV